jgi:zinc-ribbon domain
MGSSDEGNNDKKERAMSPEASDEPRTCSSCGAEVEAGAKYCTSCASPIGKKASRKARRAARRRARKEPVGVEPWAVRTGEAVRRIPRWVKIWVPLTVLIIVIVVVALSVVASGHTPQAAIERYLGSLQSTNYKTAYDMLVHQGGKFGTFDYFSQWQTLQTDRLGRLMDFSVRKRELKDKLFGKMIQPDPSEGDAYTATLHYRDKTYDVDILALNNGGAWPVTSYRIRLSEGKTLSVVSPLGAEISIDGMPVGKAVEDQDLKDALSLNHFPKDINAAVDWVRTLLRAVDNSVIDAKGLLQDLNLVAQETQNTLERVKATGTSWQQIVDAWDSVVSQSKSFATDVARAAVHIYWMFGGGDDGSVRAQYTRVQSGLDLNNLPYGWHEIKVTMPGMKPETKEFYAPETAAVSLDPSAALENDLKANLQNFFAVRSNALFTLNPAGLPAVAGGTELEQDLGQVNSLASQGLHQASDLTSLKYTDIKVLAPGVATVATEETWNYVTYAGVAPVNVITGQKNKVTYTLQRDELPATGIGGPFYGPWKVTESKLK